MKWSLKMHVCLLAAVYASSFVLAQAAPADSSAKPAEVTVGFFALDRDKHPYADLKQSDLTILDNKQPVRSIISLKKGSELPLRLGLLIDASNSQRKSELYKPGVLAAWDLLNQILKNPDDKAFVEKVTVEAEASDFMNAAQLRGYRLNAAPEGGTALYDGVGFACDSRMRTDEPRASRRVLVILSDGDDDASQISRDAAIAKALEAGVVIFSLSTADESSAPYVHGAKGDSTLEHLAEETGGEAYLHLNRKKIDQTYAAITEAINNMYVLSFDPGNQGEKGFHRIELKVSGKDKVRVRAPKGYYLK
jgi:Ca-activated chloride channel homolog